MHTFVHDLRYSVRQLIKSPGFTLTAVISLALGIGAATAVFSVIYAVLMNPYPYPAADRIVRLTTQSVAGSGDSVYLNGAQIQNLQQSPVVQSVLATDYSTLMLTGQDLPESVKTVSLISNGFQDLGVPPVLGRGLWTSDAVDGQEPQPVVVFLIIFGGNITRPIGMSWAARCNLITRASRSWVSRHRDLPGAAVTFISR
jgi:MacB-like periplasmic core domain